MRISVVIPAFNEEATLGACLESIVNQDVPAHEVIVVDNGSIDGTAKVAGNFGAKIISETQPGIVHARNAGFNAATGDVIARIDADTRAPRDWIRRIRDHFTANDCDALAGIGRPYDAPLLQTTLYMRLFFASMRDNLLICPTSARRTITHPVSFFWEYPRRTWRTLRIHR